jgi:hypothetical protein
LSPASPAKPGRAWVVMQVKRSWPEKQDSMAIDPATGMVVDQLRFADWPLAAKLARWGVDAHMGLLFGLASQIALAALAIGLICMITWGYRMWWLRRPTRMAQSPGWPTHPVRPRRLAGGGPDSARSRCWPPSRSASDCSCPYSVPRYWSFCSSTRYARSWPCRGREPEPEQTGNGAECPDLCRVRTYEKGAGPGPTPFPRRELQ